MSPCWTSRPARITAIRSATANASSWSWVTSSAVVPASRRMRAQVGGEPFAQAGVEGGERLVEQQQPGLDGQRPGQRDPLPLAAGEGGGQPVGVPLEPDEGEQLLDPARDGRLSGRSRRIRSA